MAFKMVNENWSSCQGEYMREYILDTEDDVKDLPQDCTGSSALVVETGNVYIMNASGNWSLYGG